MIIFKLLHPGFKTINHIHSDIYEYMYYFTFKKSMKLYAKDFNDAWVQYVGEVEFFEKIEDPFVKTV